MSDNKSNLDNIARNQGFASFNSMLQCASSWLQVTYLLDQLEPNWQSIYEGTGLEKALQAISDFHGKSERQRLAKLVAKWRAFADSLDPNSPGSRKGHILQIRGMASELEAALGFPDSGDEVSGPETMSFVKTLARILENDFHWTINSPEDDTNGEAELAKALMKTIEQTDSDAIDEVISALNDTPQTDDIPAVDVIDAAIKFMSMQGYEGYAIAEQLRDQRSKIVSGLKSIEGQKPVGKVSGYPEEVRPFGEPTYYLYTVLVENEPDGRLTPGTEVYITPVTNKDKNNA